MKNYNPDLFIIFNSIDFFYEKFNENNITCYRLLSYNQKKWKRFLRRIFHSFKIFNKTFYGKWTDELAVNNEKKTVIVFANDDINILDKLLQQNFEVILYYWNPVKIYKKCLPDKLDKRIKLFTFDQDDADKYNIGFNPTFYFNNVNTEKEVNTYNIIFVGEDKGRKSKIMSFLDNYEDLKLNNYIKISDENNKIKIPYTDYLETVFESQAILDINQKGQSGFTLRVMESLFFCKKLITDDSSLLNASFYHPDNIFIIGYDDKTRLQQFLNTPFNNNTEIVNARKYYEVHSWVNRFQ